MPLPVDRGLCPILREGRSGRQCAAFGRNLDALWDVLSTDVEGPFKIVWKHSDDSKNSMGKDFDRIVKLLKELEEERNDFQLKIEP